ncbi:MAG: hypothetical protein ACE5E1_01910 [Phycisphaerae bacterium]
MTTLRPVVGPEDWRSEVVVNLRSIERDLRERICPSCVRLTRQAACSLPKERPCSLFSNLDDVVRIVQETHSRQIDPYVDVLRDRVCAACHSEDEHGSCPRREDIDCALNTYYPLIVDTIEEALARQGIEEAGRGSA